MENRKSRKRLAKESLESLSSSSSSNSSKIDDKEDLSITNTASNRLTRSAKTKAKEAIHDLLIKPQTNQEKSNTKEDIKIDLESKSQDNKLRRRSKSSSSSSSSPLTHLSTSPTTSNQRSEQSTGIISSSYSRNHKESLLNRRQSNTSIASNIPNKKPRISTDQADTSKSLIISDTQIDIGDSSPLSSDSKTNSKTTVKETGGCITRPTSRRSQQQQASSTAATVNTSNIVQQSIAQSLVPQQQQAQSKHRRLLKISSSKQMSNNQPSNTTTTTTNTTTTSTITAAGNASSATTGGTTFASFLLDKTTNQQANTQGATSSTTQNRPVEESESDDNGDFSRLTDILQARGLPSHIVNAFGTKVQQFLHRTMSTGTSNRAQQLIQTLQQQDESLKLTALSELCQLLVMGNEDTLIGFPVKQAVSLLLQCMNVDNGNYDLMNHACRALTYMMESLPRSSSIIAEGIPILLEKLQIIQCMDVAEQSLTALEILSRRHSKQILHANGIAAVLTFIDFFSIAAQRNALQVASNCCQSMVKEEFVHIQSSLPILAQRLTHSDKKSVEIVCIIFSRLVENFQRDSTILKEISSHNLLMNIKQILLVQPQIVSSSVFVTILHTINIICMNCTELSVDLLIDGIGDTLKYLLIGKNQELITRAPQELYEIVLLIGEIMPKLPTTGVFKIDDTLKKSSQTHQTNQIIWQWKDEREVWRPYTPVDSRLIETAFTQEEDEVSLTTMGRQYVIDFNSMLQINEESGTARPVFRKLFNTQSATSNESNDVVIQSIDADYRLDNLNKNPQIYFDFVRSLFGILYEVYSSSAGSSIKHRCLRALLRMIYYGNADLLNDVLKNLTISSHIASMLASQDLKIIVCALQMSEILIEKLPSVYSIYFHREGVLHQIDRLIETFKPNTTQSIDTQQPTQSQLVEVKPRKMKTPKKKESKNLTDSTTIATDDGGESTLFNVSSSTNQSQAPSTSTSTRNEFSIFGSNLWGQFKASSSSRSKQHQQQQNQQSQQLAQASDNQLNENYTNINLNKDLIRKWIYEQAKCFKEKYFASNTNKDETSTKLIKCADKLTKNSLEALKEISNIINESDISAFEMIHSDLISKLVEFLTSDTLTLTKTDRIRQFLNVFTGLPLNDNGVPLIISNTNLLESFVIKLHNCINQLEQYAVKVNDMPTSIGYGKTAIKFFNTHQIKCLLQRHSDSSTQIREWKNGPVKVDPLAQVSAIERYLILRRINKAPSSATAATANESDDDSENDSEDDIEEAMSAILGRTSNDDGPKLELVLNGHVLPSNMTVYQAIKQYSHHDTDNEGDSESFMANEIWSKVHTLFYRVATKTSSMTNTTISPLSPNTSNEATNKRTTRFMKSSSSSSKEKSSKQSSSELNLDNNRKLLNDDINSTWLKTLSINDLSLNTISLLRIIYVLNRKWYLTYSTNTQIQSITNNEYFFIVNSNEFVNTKLTSKANRQLQDPLVIMTGHLPKWLPELIKTCPFLFPFETRQMYFYIATFDRDRSMLKLLDMTNNDHSTHHETTSTQTSAPKLDRKKKTINRDELLKHAESILNDFTKSKALLEIQYENEVGTGLGPTLEFYALVSLELQKCDYELWRGDRIKLQTANGTNKEQLFFQSPNGLYPAPLAKNAKQQFVSKIKSKFKFFGRFVAKALMDFRVLDIQLNYVFYKWLLDSNTLSDIDLKLIDSTLYKSLESLKEYLRKHIKLVNKSKQNSLLTQSEAKIIENELICLDKTVKDLELDFTLPGYPNIELKKNGKDLLVTIHNLEEYIKLVTQYTLIDGVQKQFESFKEGFNSIFPISSLAQFYPEELERLFCGSGFDLWDSKLLIECTRCDHGYTHDSKAVKFLFDIMCSFNADEQRLFLQFVTGSPRLPVGGLRSLVPQLTIVRKTIENNDNPDNYLPSVMTCVNYLKLPEYSTLEIMKDKLIKAMTDGQLSFNLS